ncbi:hypothetical protein B0F90DRAFT_456578 [Multifurca ochricompacta]|uniref:Uncharacterized protein n=1 Tax=Multifurca ochricompacta TaxID=376703 RepID=A0AAD4M3R9_9AGAM|nr:hypothetical protein B0F90DRAFT_456578 [Multifurca ochricompacta]
MPLCTTLATVGEMWHARGSSERDSRLKDQNGIGVDGERYLQRRWITGVPTLGSKARPRIVGGEENLVKKILCRLSDWFTVLKELPGVSLRRDDWDHWIYLFFLPFQLVAQFVLLHDSRCPHRCLYLP